jgi:hypothetical protein
MLVMPDKPWRIITSADHSTVWDGGDLIFEFNFQAFGIDPNECFKLASEKELLPGKSLPVYFAEHYTIEQSRERCAAMSRENFDQQNTCCIQDDRIQRAIIERISDNAGQLSTSA